MSGRDVVRGPAGSNDSRVYVGNLPRNIREKEVRRIFDKYGEILDVDLKIPQNYDRGGSFRAAPYAFIQFEDRL